MKTVYLLCPKGCCNLVAIAVDKLSCCTEAVCSLFGSLAVFTDGYSWKTKFENSVSAEPRAAAIRGGNLWPEGVQCNDCTVAAGHGD